jgi:hypothetical protein
MKCFQTSRSSARDLDHAVRTLALFQSIFGSACEAAAFLANRLRGNVGPHQSVSELTVSAAFALPDHDPARAQLFESNAQPRFKAFFNVIDGNAAAALKSFQKNVIKRQFGTMLSPRKRA